MENRYFKYIKIENDCTRSLQSCSVLQWKIIYESKNHGKSNYRHTREDCRMGTVTLIRNFMLVEQ